LDWLSASAKPAGAGSNKLPSAFETNARTLRYQALGKACLHADIKTILLGHHQDDNVETAISRLCTGARSAALGGISEMARIPECHGLWGISEGPSYAKLLGTRKSGDMPVMVHIKQDTNRGKINFHTPGRFPKSVRRQQKDQPSWVSLQPPSTSSPLLTATGGIFLCRPLLSFPKARLVQTCIDNKVPYVSDPTNFDPTLTTRNTIRHLLSKNALPRALQPASILSLIETGQKSLKKMNDLSNEMLASSCRILDFNPRAGNLAIAFKVSCAG
jgi:Predicted ATPase of the PP-loop superfamily implicated in cell cycle control